MTLKKKLENWTAPVYSRYRRLPEHTLNIQEYLLLELGRRVDYYHLIQDNEPRCQVVREDIDQLLRRYYRLCIEETIGAHYVEIGVAGPTVFEHMVPNSIIRDLLLDGVLTLEQACNMPTCRISKEKDVLLREAGWNQRTPDVYNFWTRYSSCFQVEGHFETYDAIEISPSLESLDTHFDRFIRQADK